MIATFELPPPLSLYVHLPWCVRKCPYCDFNSHALRDDLDEARYVDALLADLEAELPAVWGRTVGTVFIGGGTPSLFSPGAIARLLSGIRARLRLSADAEVTLEANPGASDAGRFAGYVEAGVTRISVGVQSFDDALLGAIGRIHDGVAARAAVRAALASGAGRVNLDLMFALPGQTIAEVRADVLCAIELGVRHVSFYQLTLEPNTAFHRAPPPLPEPDAAADMHEAGMALLAGAGLERYEISAFAAPQHACRHNLNYWRFGDYLGIGAGAHGKHTLAGEGRVVRSHKARHPKRYLELAGTAGVAERREVAPAERPFEFMLNALRLTGGFDLALYRERTGLAPDTVEPALVRAEADGLIERDGTHIAPSAQGLRFLDDLTARFLPA